MFEAVQPWLPPHSAGWSQEPTPPLAGNGEKVSQETFLHPGLWFSLTVELPKKKKKNQDLQICSEDRYSRGRVEVPDCPLPALQIHPQILTLFSMKEQASGICHSWRVPHWPQLSYCLSFQTRIRAYLVKGKGLLLSKLPRDTAMRPLSRRGKRKRMDSQTGALPQSISTPWRESGSLCPYVRCVALHTEVSLYEPRMFLRDETH